MTKTLNTLVNDINDVLEGAGGWDSAISEYMTTEMEALLERRFQQSREDQAPSLRMSNLGTECERKLWKSINEPKLGEPLGGSTLLKFLYGDIIELLVISLAKAAGHKVEGCQDILEINGVLGHRDAVIDGVTVDVKSCSPYSFDKFQKGLLREDDPFGYIYQLSSYVYAGRNSEVESHPTIGAFIAVNKVSGGICLDVYDFSGEIEKIEEDVERLKQVVASDQMPGRGYEDKEDGYFHKTKGFVPNGNRVLGLQCGYCSFKESCWPQLRTFLYKKGDTTKPVFFTHVKKEPKVMEVTK